MFIKQLNINQTYFSKAKQLKCWLISLAVLIVLIVVGVLLVLLIGPRLIPSFLVDNSNSNTLTNYSNNDTLVFASVIFRHGFNWQEFEAMPLSKEGMKQMYQAGRFYRRRYANILGDLRYSFDKVYTLATDTERAIMSAQVTLTGLFPLTDEDNKWSDELRWQPIPFRTLPDEMDTFFRGGKPCPKYFQLHDYFMERSPEAIDIMTKYADEIAIWNEKWEKNITTIQHIADLHRAIKYMEERIDEFGVEDEFGKLKDWHIEALKRNSSMEYIKDIVYRFRGRPELVRLRVGSLLKEITEHFAQKLNATLNPDRSLWLYSTHSSTFIPILNGLGFYEMELPPFASSLHFELYRTSENEHYIQMFYRKPDEEYPAPMEVPGCGEKWTLDQFYSLHGDLIPGDFDLECQL